MERKHIKVVAAVIRDGDQIFATQRGYGNYKDWREFPGGKVEPGETPEEALVTVYSVHRLPTGSPVVRSSEKSVS